MKKRDLINYVNRLGFTLDILKQIGKSYRKKLKDKLYIGNTDRDNLLKNKNI
jgi:hypothetical protein